MTEGFDGHQMRPVEPQGSQQGDAFQAERQLQPNVGDARIESNNGPTDRIGRYVGEVATETMLNFLNKEQLTPAQVRLVAGNVDLMNRANAWDDHKTQQVMFALDSCADRQTNPAASRALRTIADHVGAAVA